MRLPALLPARILSEKSLRDRLDLAGIILLALYLIAGVIYSASVPFVARFVDEIDYAKISQNLIHGPGFSLDGVHLTASRAPGYAFFLAAIRSVGGDIFSFRVVQFLLLGGTILLVGCVCAEKKLFGGLLIATGLVICYPILFYTSGTLYPQILSGFLFVLALTLNLVNTRSLAINLATGVAFGALILVVPTFLFTLVVVQVTAWFLNFVRWRDVFVIVIAAALIVSSWTLRNEIVFHRFVPVASNSGMNFLMGNNEESTATDAASNSIMTSYFLESIHRGYDEFQADQFYKDTAVEWIKSHPWDAFVNYCEKVLNFFNVVNGYTKEARGEVSPAKQMVMAASYLFLLGLLTWRLADTRRFPLVPREKLLLTVYVLSAFTSAIFFTRLRLRLPYDYLIMSVIALYLSRRLELAMATALSKDASNSIADEKTADSL